MALIAGPAIAQDQIRARYNIELGGAKIMKVDFAADLGGKSYASSIDARSVGLTKWLSKLRLILETKGRVNNGAFVATSYTYARTKNGDRRDRYINFAPDGSMIPAEEERDANVLKSVNERVLDPLTLLLKLSFSQQPCAGHHRAFDARDVFDIKLRQTKKEGGRLHCAAVYIPVAGGEVRDGDTSPKDYEFTLAPLSNAGGRGYIPTHITGSIKSIGFDVRVEWVTLNGEEVNFQ